MGGWWEGGSHTKPNKEFLKQVTAKIPTSDKVLVTCQKGLRCVTAKAVALLGSQSAHGRPHQLHCCPEPPSKASLPPAQDSMPRLQSTLSCVVRPS